MSGKPGAPRILHILGTVAAGDPQAERCARVIDAFGGRLRHTLVSGDGRWGALDSVAAGVPVQRLTSGFPALRGLPLPGRLQAIARGMVDYHLVLTYGRGGVDAALAHTIFSEAFQLPPLIHHEDGSDETPRQRRGLRSTWYRRIGLGKAAGLVVPTELMEGEALVRWQQPFGRVKVIPDGVDLAALGKKRANDAIPRLLKHEGESWIGCLAQLGELDAIDPLLAALTHTDQSWHMVLADTGEGAGASAARAALEARIAARSLDNRVHIVPKLADSCVLIGLSDVVAIPAGTAPLPYAALLAMGAGKPVAGMESGALEASLGAANQPFIAPPGDGEALGSAFAQLTTDRYSREQAGQSNRERAAAERDEKAMIAAFRRLYASAMKRDTI